MLEYLKQRMKELLESRVPLKSELDEVLKAPSAEKRDLSDAESKVFTEKRDALRKIDDDIKAIEERIAELEEIDARGQKAAEIRSKQGPSVQVLSEPMIYGRGSTHSYFLDLARDTRGFGDGDGGVDQARKRLQRHAAELKVELPAREARRNEIAQRELRGLPGLSAKDRENAFEKRVNPNRTDGQGGYFVPPVWIIDDYIAYLRFGRVAANLCRTMTLPSGTDSINIPKVNSGTATAVQTADAAAVTSTDMTDTSVTAGVKTIAGQQDVAIQLLDQSPISFDEIIFADLISDYNQKLDLQVINGSGSGNQATGILNVGSINGITYTDATPTLPELYVPLAQGASQVAKNRKQPATAALMIPSVWYWATSQLDTTNRPLISQAPMNPVALQNGLAEEGPVGALSFGLPVYADGNIPVNLGAGSNETRIIEAKWDDLYLWEGAMRSRVLPEVLSGTLQIRFQIYNYFAFMGNRRPESISVLSGTGLIPAAGF